MPDHETHYVELTFDVNDPKEFYDWAKAHLPGVELGDPDQTTAGLILAAMMRISYQIPGVECYGGGAHADYSDRAPVAGRTPAFHRHVNEHAHPDGGKPHVHHVPGGPRVAGRHYFAPADVIPARALHEETPAESQL